MCKFMSLNKVYINILKNKIYDLEEEIEEYKQLYFIEEDKIREIRNFINRREEEFTNANEDSRSAIGQYHYEMIINKIKQIVGRR